MARKPKLEPEESAGAPASALPLTLDLYPIRIGYFKPEAREVYLAGSFNGWDSRATPLVRDAFGDWSIELSLPSGEHRYRLLVDGVWQDDPSAQRMEANPFGSYDAVIVV